MNRPTLSTFRAQFPTEAMGICQTDPKVAVFCNDSQERLMIDPMAPDEGWFGMWLTMTFNASVNCNSAYITTPREVARLIVTDVCRHPVHLRNGFYEYLAYGRGLQPKPCPGIGCGATFQAFERDNVFTLFPLLPTAQIIRLFPTDSRDSGLRVLLQGIDANGQTILTTDPGTGLSAPGEYIVLKFPFVNSVNHYTKITGIQKDETFGQVQFFQVDPTTSVEVALSSMQPGEASANYRRYLINGIPNINQCCIGPGVAQVTAQVRLDFVPVTNETDYLTIPCVPALIEESMSIRYSRMDSSGAAQQSAIHHSRALSLLNGQLDAYEGKTNVSVKVPLFGSNRMRRQPV